MKNFKTRKQILLDIFLVISICVLIVGIILAFNKSTLFVSTNSVQDNNTQITIPNVIDENTTFKISDTKKNVKSVNITIEKKLDNYNLYYFINLEDMDPSEMNNTYYTLLNDTTLTLDENCSIYFKYELNGNYSTEFYKITISNIITSEVTSEKVSDKELKEATVNKNEISKQSTSPYYIKVNYGANVVTIYTKNKDGNYTVPYKAMICSCGKYTPKSGTYKTSNKYAWRPLVHNVYGQYATRIVKKILFHSVPYSTNKKDALLYEEYDKLGTKASEGCVRLTVKDAKWIYDNCPSNTMVEFYSDSNPGPLGKPSAQKISSVEECRNWDPTDPAADNPWHTYKKEEEKTNEDISNNVINDVSNNVTNNVINENLNNTIDSNTIDNSVNNITNNMLDNSTANNITNEIVNNSVVNNSSSNNSTIEDTNSTVNNTNVDNSTTNNNIDNNTVDNSATDTTIGNNVVNDSTENVTTNTNDNSSNLDNTNSNNSSDTENNTIKESNTSDYNNTFQI